MQNEKKLIPIPILILIDILLLGISLCIFSYFHHVRTAIYSKDLSSYPTTLSEEPADAQNEVADSEIQNDSTTSEVENNSLSSETKENTSSETTGDFSEKFADKFQEETVSTDTSYISSNLNITVSSYTENGVTYHIQDIYVKSIDHLKTAFAKDSYGKSITESVSDMADNNNAIAAINGDYYGIQDSGIVIRNGYVYRDVKDTSSDVCVLYYDGTMKIFHAEEFDAETEIENNAYQAWSFGPGLVIDNEAVGSSVRDKRLSKENPRTAIGYYEPGHYCFITIDGRGQNDSEGMTFVEMSELFVSLGCNAAYNLDGGKSSVMTFLDHVVNSPVSGGRNISDIIYVSE